MPKKPIDKEIEDSLEEGEQLEDEKGYSEEETEESEPIDPNEQLRQQKKRILDKIEKQLELSDFWQTVLGNKSWEEILRIYYRLNAGLVQKFYASFTIKAVLEGDKIEWKYTFFDSNGKEVNFDILNKAGAKE
jgi:hypothetical protein